MEGTDMGKTAENERIKLRATFYNNVGVGLTLVGVLVPTLGVLPVIAKFFADITSGHSVWSLEGAEKVLTSAVVFVATMRIAVLLRRAADKEISKIEEN
jgi:uncharacterized membrane protein